MLVKLARRGGRKPPRDNELLTVEDDGSFTLWRSVGWTTQPPTPVGRFAGRLAGEEWERLRAEVAAAQQAGDLQMTPRPDSSVDAIELAEGARGRLGNNDRPTGPWAALVATLRTLLVELTAYPQAALALEVKADGSGARLMRHGSQPLDVALDDLTVRAVQWREHAKTGDWSAPRDNALVSRSQETTEDGWTFELPFDHGFAMEPGCEVVAYVNLAIYDNGRRVPVSLQSLRSSAR
jgi:hypothetical protein